MHLLVDRSRGVRRISRDLLPLFSLKRIDCSVGPTVRTLFAQRDELNKSEVHGVFEPRVLT
jgi:hypothetical protein